MSAAPLPESTPRQTAPARSASGATLCGKGAWLIEAGYADVFASLPPERPGGGRRHHLFRMPTGKLVFGLPPSDAVTFEAVGTDLTVLTPLTPTVVAGRRRWEHGHDEGRALERWVDCLCEYVAGGMPPQDSLGRAAGEEVTLSEPRCVRADTGVLALELVSGQARLCGRDAALEAGTIILLSWRAWLELPGGATVRARAVSELTTGQVWAAVHALHRAMIPCVAARLDDIARAERARSIARATSARAASASAFGAIAAVFHSLKPGQLTSAPVLATAHDEMNAACRLVATQLGAPFVAPHAKAYRTVKEGVENVARSSGFRARHIVLDEGWWRHEHGPLLGFTKADTRPVALLPRRRGGYELVSPGESAPQRVDAAVAATLAPKAVTFYRPFPAGAVGFLDLVKFAGRGIERDLLMVLLAGALSGVIGMGVPIATGILVNAIIPSTDRVQLSQWTLMLLACTVATTLFNVNRGIALIRLEMKLGYAIQAAVWDRLISLPVRFFRNYSAGDLATRAMGIDAVRQTLSGATIRGVLGGMFSVFNFALLFYYDAWLAIVGTMVIGLAVAVLAGVAYFQRIQQREAVAVQVRISGTVLQLLTGVRKLRVAGAEMRAFQIWANLFARKRAALLRISRLGNGFAAFSVTLPLISWGALFTVILNNPASQSMRTGDFLAFMAAFAACLGAVLATAGAAIGALSIAPQYEMARPILQEPPEISAGQEDPGVLSGDIAVDHVVFGYDREAPPILNDITFRVKAGEFVAFVGPSGSGKSTILRLLLGFETPQSGAVSYDSRDFKQLDVRAVRRQIGVVLQSGRLMPGDMYTNIVGCSAATMDEAWAASRMAGFDEDLKAMPMGMHTMVSDGGGTLSGGQRQRLMIARAIVTAPRMLLFDEATSALDNHTQAVVSQSLERLRATRIVIAHRLSTIINADRIFVVEKGRIVQSGTYEELMAQPGTFRELASRQVA